MATKKTVENPEFLYLSLGDILIEEQVRSGIDTEGESFKSLMESIKDRGILEPVLVTPKDGKYLLLCGERRYLAAQKLELPSVPARVVDAITQKDEILAFQLTENLQREDLNPIDQAKGILAYIQARHPDNGYDVTGVMNELVNYDRRPEDLSKEIADTVSAISEISGKSIRTLSRTISLLKLSDEIQAAIREGKLPVSQGYIFASHLDCVDLKKVFDSIMAQPVTNSTLERMLTRKSEPPKKPAHPTLSRQRTSVKSIRTAIEENAGKYKKEDLEELFNDLCVLCDYVQQQAAATVSTKPRKPQL
ncbi:MAG: ParB/RepB/Spo0J family partition protein [Proteobacteria bacterium]|nr:ParB/RepB/Spo0J family partition protein [Pseudomonadota bacterium]